MKHEANSSVETALSAAESAATTKAPGAPDGVPPGYHSAPQGRVAARALLSAALAGLALAACNKDVVSGKTNPATSGTAHAEGPAADRDCCMGKNDCKGKGGCAVPESNSCAGMNECKGKGGCNMNCPKDGAKE